MEDHPDFQVFSHLAADNVGLYRAVMNVFMDARERFFLHLNMHDVWNGLSPVVIGRFSLPDESALASTLKRLSDWGNLSIHADLSDVRTVEDFKKPRHLFQLTPEGEAVERSLAYYREWIERPGELQATALADIEARLRELRELRAVAPPPLEKVHQATLDLFDRFEGLTQRAQQFMGGVQRAIDLRPEDIETFLRYKEALIQYLEQFIRELVVRGAGIAVLLGELPADSMEQTLAEAADRDLADALQPSPEAVAANRMRWLTRWRGLSHWFIGEDGPSQAEQLRALARSAIPKLLAVISTFNDRRIQKSDRAADYLALARWFAQIPSREDAHALWRAAFCLSPARHLALTRETTDRDEEYLNQPRIPWLEAKPLLISPRLRTTGFIQARGRSPAIIDRTAGKTEIRLRREAETRRLEAARHALARAAGAKLSEFARLDRYAFALLLECLESVFGKAGGGKSAKTGVSSDGTMRLSWRPIPDAPPARIESEDGALEGPDGWVTIEPVQDEMGGPA